ncbi:linamarin synthase 2-like [Cryptomeria japonica]|uniref:linamarin synthase 2-like n=1 Tax=Cryptomeria japonica TaxID=3369 RepID=UPI0025AD3877|nr:linamarin synthase 2-like [Cryptomeria japonica]
MVMWRRHHAVVVPFPVQGHINPMMHLAKMLSSHGFMVTFINTDHVHSRMLKLNSFSNSIDEEGIQFRHIPDGLPESDCRTDFAKLASATENTMPLLLRNLIYEINESRDCPPVTFLVADFFAGWALDVAHHFNIPAAAFWPGLIATYAIIHHIPSLISKGVIPSNVVEIQLTVFGLTLLEHELVFSDFKMVLDIERFVLTQKYPNGHWASLFGFRVVLVHGIILRGFPKGHAMVKYLASMPPLYSANLPWLIGSKADKEFRFQFWVRNMNRLRKLKWVLCNSFHDLELPILNMFPEEVGMCPIGPFISNLPREKTTNNQSLWREEFECLDWLDKHSSKSVIYVSFGSIAILNERQLEELALGLEATKQPFLWVVRSDLMDRKQAVFPSGFLKRVNTSNQGCIVSWAPQTSVLSHPSIACFVTHCGWNSTMESITAGVPMLCWPYYADQFLNCAYITHVWKIGLALNPNQRGLIEAEEIKSSVWRTTMGEECAEMKENVAKLKGSAMGAVKAGGSSYNTFTKFLHDMDIYE